MTNEKMGAPTAPKANGKISPAITKQDETLTDANSQFAETAAKKILDENFGPDFSFNSLSLAEKKSLFTKVLGAWVLQKNALENQGLTDVIAVLGVLSVRDMILQFSPSSKKGTMSTWQILDTVTSQREGIVTSNEGVLLEIKPNSSIAKLLQITTLLGGFGVQNKDNQSVGQSIDGNIGRFSSQGLTQLQAHLKTQVLQNIVENMKINQYSDWAKVQLEIVRKSIESTGTLNQSLRGRRFPSDIVEAIKVGPDMKATLIAYGQTLTIDLKSPGSVTLLPKRKTENTNTLLKNEKGGDVEKFPFIVGVPWVLNAQTKLPLISTNSPNEKLMQETIRTALIIAYITDEYVRPKDADSPFTIPWLPKKLVKSGMVYKEDNTVVLNSAQMMSMLASGALFGATVTDKDWKPRKLSAQDITDYFNKVKNTLYPMGVVPNTDKTTFR